MTKKQSENLNILVTRLQNIGDALVFIPAVRALRQALPEARITFLGKHAGGLEVMKGCPYIDKTIVVRGRGLGEKVRLIREFRKRRLDYFIISPQDLGRVPWAWLGGAKKIVGYPAVRNHGRFGREKLTRLLSIAPHYDTTRTEIENCLRLAQDVLDDIGAPLHGPISKRLEFSWYTEDDQGRAGRLLQKAGVGEGDAFVASSPMSKRVAKNWPRERLVALFREMIGEWRAPVILLGGRAEQESVQALQREVGAQCHSLAGETTLAESAAILNRARLFFGPDSGPAFMATAVGTPAVVLYGPADYYRWRVPTAEVPRIEIFHPMPCNPCRHQVCPKSRTCMETIELDEAWSACRELWEESAAVACKEN